MQYAVIGLGVFVMLVGFSLLAYFRSKKGTKVSNKV